MGPPAIAASTCINFHSSHIHVSHRSQGVPLTEAVAVGALSIQDGGGSHLFLCDLAVLLVDAQADGRVARACAKVRDSWQLVNGVLPRLIFCARGSGRGGSGRGGRRRSCSGGWHWNFGGDRLAERGWAILGKVVAVGVAPEVSARWENAFVGGLDLPELESCVPVARIMCIGSPNHAHRQLELREAAGDFVCIGSSNYVKEQQTSCASAARIMCSSK